MLYGNLLHYNPINLLDFTRPAFPYRYISNDKFGQCNPLPGEVLVEVQAFIHLLHQSCSNLASNSSPNGRWLCKAKRAFSSSSSFNPVCFGPGQGWPDAPDHSINDHSHSLFPFCAICSLVHLQPNFIYTLFKLPPPYLLWPFSISLPIHFKHQCPL